MNGMAMDHPGGDHHAGSSRNILIRQPVRSDRLPVSDGDRRIQVLYRFFKHRAGHHQPLQRPFDIASIRQGPRSTSASVRSRHCGARGRRKSDQVSASCFASGARKKRKGDDICADFRIAQTLPGFFAGTQKRGEEIVRRRIGPGTPTASGAFPPGMRRPDRTPPEPARIRRRSSLGSHPESLSTSSGSSRPSSVEIVRGCPGEFVRIQPESRPRTGCIPERRWQLAPFRLQYRACSGHGGAIALPSHSPLQPWPEQIH